MTRIYETPSSSRLIAKKAARLKDHLKRSGVKQKELSEILSVSRNTLSKLINGKQEITLEWAVKLSYALKVSPSYILCERDTLGKVNDDANSLRYAIKILTQKRANRLREVLAEQGMTQSQLARKIGCDPQNINKIIHGYQTLSHGWAQRISKGLNINPEYLLMLSSDIRKEIDDDNDNDVLESDKLRVYFRNKNRVEYSQFPLFILKNKFRNKNKISIYKEEEDHESSIKKGDVVVFYKDLSLFRKESLFNGSFLFVFSIDEGVFCGSLEKVNDNKYKLIYRDTGTWPSNRFKSCEDLQVLGRVVWIGCNDPYV